MKSSATLVDDGHLGLSAVGASRAIQGHNSPGQQLKQYGDRHTAAARA